MLYYLGYPDSITEESIHSLDEKYDECIEGTRSSENDVWFFTAQVQRGSPSGRSWQFPFHESMSWLARSVLARHF